MPKATFSTEQEEFWAGTFGTEYSQRNRGERAVAVNCGLFASVLRSAGMIRTVTELGANIGLNLQALGRLLPEARFTGVEINPDAAREMALCPRTTVVECSLFEYTPTATADLAFTKGVLIHLHPDRLAQAYDRLDAASHRLVLVSEYYNPVPVEVRYRGHENRLFKRDFAGEFMDRHPRYRLLDYGFIYHRDSTFPQDDVTWFLMEKPC